MKSDYVKFIAPVALVSAIVYLHLYWYSFDIIIFDFLSFSGLINYCIIPFMAALGILLTSFVVIFMVNFVEKGTRKRATLLFVGIGGFVLAIVVLACFIGLHVLWFLLPFIGAPLAAYGLDLVKRGHSLFPDPNIRLAVYFSVCLVLFSAVASGKMQAGGVLTRTDYYTIESKGTVWIYLGKADNLVFLLPEKGGSIVVDKVDSVTPFVLVHHRSKYLQP
jgi:hypothetical protein